MSDQAVKYFLIVEHPAGMDSDPQCWYWNASGQLVKITDAKAAFKKYEWLGSKLTANQLYIV